MNPAHELARERYRSYLEDAFDSEELLELARLLELEIPDECDPADMTAVLESIVGRIEEAGALDSLLMQEDRSTLGLLVQLLDLGEVHPPCSFHSDSFGLGTEHDVEVEDFFVLKRVGLVSVSVLFDKPLLTIHPWARHLLAERIEAFRRERFEREHPQLRSSIPLLQVLALSANHIRGNGVRMTAKGQVHKRHLDRASLLFEPLAENRGLPPVKERASLYFEVATAALLHLHALRIRGDARLEVVPGQLESVLRDRSPSALAQNLLARSDPGSNTATGLLELLRDWSTTLPEGWATFAHLQVNGELLLLAEGVHPDTDSVSSSGEPAQLLRRKLVELGILGLVDEAITENGEVWYRLSARGSELLDRIADPEVTSDGSADDSADNVTEQGLAEEGPVRKELSGGVIQPNLDIVVGIDAEAEVHWRVGAVARLDSVDQLCRYTLDKDHTRSVFSREGGDGDRWIEALAACAAHGIPENIEKTLRSWIDQVRPVEMVEGTVVRLPGTAASDDAARAALWDAAERLGAERLERDAIFIPADIDRERIVAALNDQGLCPEGEEHREGGTHDPAVHDGEGAIRILRGRLNELRRFQEIYLQRVPDESPDVGREEIVSEPQAPDATADSPQPDWVEADATAISVLLHAAVRTNQTVEIVLDTSYMNKSRRLQPESVMRRGTKTYVTGLCLETEENRAFPLQAIVRARMMNPEVPSQRPSPMQRSDF